MRILGLVLGLVLSTSVLSGGFTVTWPYGDATTVDGFKVYYQDNTDPANPGGFLLLGSSDSQVLQANIPDGKYCLAVSAYVNIQDPSPQTVETVRGPKTCFETYMLTPEIPGAPNVTADPPISGGINIIIK